ncbi:folylpolyglutamate synthase/dihydrofolate synthase family protein [Synechococcus sp. MW101C3]|uniref:bifunctional folylpolyglutamate synthase/dihydrofolate synthase n=1 Tax=Synechococcus sp. MW101C3 TaxID=210768 RepID=UPI001E451B19|nr:Mur ligase family protein [Synechococcus sp. MW101C3]
MDLGLERLRAALAELGHPERRFAAVQVAGTNGKGSICVLLHAALQAAGHRCGLYTSPHLVSWCERIQLGAAPIAPAHLRRLLTALQPLARRHDLTPFELVTAAAFVAFAEAGLEIVVLEVGLGGRLDATTVHPDRRVLGFASIGLDHAEFLGDSEAAIAAEKAGVLHGAAAAVSGPQRPDVAAVLAQRAQQQGCPLHWVRPLEQQGQELVAGRLRWRHGLPGDMQRTNAAVALEMLQVLRRQGWHLPDGAISAGFAAARWPGRRQRARWGQLPLLLDGAHNLPAAQALRAELDGGGRGTPAPPQLWVLGMLANKQGPEMVHALLAPADRCWLVPVPGHACWSAAELRSACPERASALLAAASLEEGLAAASTVWETVAGAAPVVVAGSLYLLGSLLAAGTLDLVPGAGESEDGMSGLER